MTNVNQNSGPASGFGGPGGILRYFVEHRTAANLLLILMLVAGAVSATNIRAQFFPDVVIESIRVSVKWSGVGPKEMDEAIVSRLEPPLRGVEGVDRITAVAREGTATVSLEFQPGWNMSDALADVESVTGEITDLPEDADKPVVTRRRFRDRVTDVIISGPVEIALLDRYASELKTHLFKAGVTRTSIQGITAPVIRVDARPEALERYRLSIQNISDAIAAETGTQPVGEIDKGASRVRIEAKRESAETIGAIAVRSLANGTKLRLRDVATVHEEGLDRGAALYRNGVPAVQVRVERDAQGDALALQAAVEKAIKEVQPTLPKGVDVMLARPRATAIADRLDILIRNGISGLVIVLALLFLFLSARTAFWVAAGIPAAMAATVGLMYVFGLTFNMVSLFALIICLGIVVDDAIVVGEHADHLARQGLSPVDAAAAAARRMAAPVFSASITTVIAFAALSLIGGRFGKLISDMPFTVAVVILASLLESFLILPAHMRHAIAASQKQTWIDAPSRFVNRGFDWFRETLFRPFARGVIRLRYPVVAAALLMLAISIAALLDRTVRWRFFSAPERGTITANIAMLPGATRENTKAMLDEMDRALNVVDGQFAKKYGTAPVKLAMATLGGTTGRGLSGADTKDPDTLGGYNIELIDPDFRPYSAFDFISEWRNEIRRHPMLETLALRGQRRGPGGDAIHIRIAGSDGATLKAAAQYVKSRLSRYTAVSGLEDDLAYDKPELLVKLTPKGEALGFTTASVARALRQRLDGAEATSFARDSREVKVKVRLPESETNASYLHRATLPLSGGGFVPLTEIATINETQGFSTIRRENGERVVTVTGDISDDAAARDEVADALANDILPAAAAQYGINHTLGGLSEQERDFLSDAYVGFGLCLVGIYLTLAWVFGSWTRPLIVILVIPFGLIGAIWGHYFHGLPMSIFSVVGLIGMAGIIINDSIVLVTTIDERLPHQDIITATVDGAANRLRAVLLTTLTTVGGLTPLLLEQSRQALFLKPTVITLAYGLGFGVVLVLLVTPAMIAIQHDIGSHLNSMRRLARLIRSGPRRVLSRA